jgi:hypothetical protein
MVINHLTNVEITPPNKFSVQTYDKFTNACKEKNISWVKNQTIHMKFKFFKTKIFLKRKQKKIQYL